MKSGGSTCKHIRFAKGGGETHIFAGLAKRGLEDPSLGGDEKTSPVGQNMALKDCEKKKKVRV